MTQQTSALVEQTAAPVPRRLRMSCLDGTMKSSICAANNPSLKGSNSVSGDRLL